MTAETAPSLPDRRGALIRHIRSHRPQAVGLTLAMAAVVGLILLSNWRILTGEPIPGLGLALAGGLAAFAATALGGVPALAVRALPQKLEDSLLGAAAGMMLAASAFSLILPGLAASEKIVGHGVFSALIVVVGMAFGVLLMLGLEAFTPHLHPAAGSFGPGAERWSRIWLFVFAITLHNLPEGMAIGVAFSHADLGVGVPLTTAIALQDMPEGLAVALALRGGGMKPLAAVLVAAASGFVEPLGALVGIGLTGGLAIAYPIGLGLAAGAMIFVVSHEVIPETHRNGHQTPATVGLMFGFALMMVLDTALG
ncbi:ZIP family metal transporter [Pinisolibacter sp.]|uniref:ZIP family metal transporter n=1 Tax=Pinisolibacter sp. TaxID=2172024 RepID=UPI002FDD8AE9